jgi:hypothetical protein
MIDAEELYKTNTKYYNSDIIDKYTKMYEEYIRLNNIVINKKKKIAKEDYEIENTVDSIYARFKQSNVKIQKPIYQKVDLLMEQVTSDIVNTWYSYNKLKKQCLYDLGNSLSQNSVISTLEKLTEKINKLYALRDTIKMCYLLHKEEVKNKIEKNDIIVQMEKDSLGSSLDEVRNNVSDSIRYENLIQEYVKLDHNENIINIMKERTNLENQMNSITEIVMKLPNIGMSDNIVNGTPSSPSSSKNNKKDLNEDKINKKAKKILKKTATKAFESPTYKKKMKKFLFNTLEECNNSKRSKDYYMSRDQIIQMVNKDENLQRKLGNVYKNLSKKSLCKKIIDTLESPNTSNKTENDESVTETKSEVINDVNAIRFPFTNKSECESSKRSKVYYMSREDIIEMISKDVSMQSKAGSNYKKLSKAQLCNKLME